MSEQEDTLRSPKYFHQDEEKQIRQQGGDELTPPPDDRDARGNPEQLRENRKRLGVDDDHETEKMRKEHRGSFP